MGQRGISCVMCDDSIAYGLVPGHGDPPMCGACQHTRDKTIAEVCAFLRSLSPIASGLADAIEQKFKGGGI